MTKLSKKSLSRDQLVEFTNNLWSAFVLMDAKEDIRLLFKDLFTHTEYKMFAKRLEIARDLLRLKEYQQIEERLHVTPVTISKISNILAERGEGLRKAHEKLQQMEDHQAGMRKAKTDILENPLKNKFRKRTLLGTTIKAGIDVLGKKIDKKTKMNTAEKLLDL